MRKKMISLYLLVTMLLAGCGVSLEWSDPTETSLPPARTGEMLESSATTSQSTATKTLGEPNSTFPPELTPEPETTNLPTFPPAPTNISASDIVWSRPLILQEPRISGGDVELAQRRLLELGYAVAGLPDGIFGPQTEAAVRIFQARHGLSVDGVVGEQTWARLFDKSAAGPAPATAVLAAGDHSDRSSLLGGSQQGIWLSADLIAPAVLDGQRYTAYSAQSALGELVGKAPRKLEEIGCFSVHTVQLSGFPPAGTRVGLSTTIDWNPLPRTPVELDASTPAYQQAVSALLREQGIAAPELIMTGALRVDLEGDGSTELVVSATRHRDGMVPSAAAGDYSLVAILRGEGDALRATMVKGDLYPEDSEFSAPETYRVDALLDLNGDGVLEILVNMYQWEGGSLSVYALAGSAVVDTGLRYGCSL